MNNNVDFLTRKRCPSSRSSVKRLGTFRALVCLLSCSCRLGFGRIKVGPEVFDIPYARLLISGQIE